MAQNVCYHSKIEERESSEEILDQSKLGNQLGKLSVPFYTGAQRPSVSTHTVIQRDLETQTCLSVFGVGI